MSFRKTNKSPHPVDIHVGRRVRACRVMQAMTQTTLAEHLGLTFQQLQKYEKGANRISAGRLWEIANIFNVSVTWFFQGLDGGTSDSQDMPTNETVKFVHVLQSLPTGLQMHVRQAVKALADMNAQ